MSSITIVKVEGTPEKTDTKRKEMDKDVSSLEDDGIEIVQVTPSPNKRKKGKEVVLLNVKKPGRPVDVYKKRYVIHTMGCTDNSNVLSTVPGGYTGLYQDYQYINLLHKKLSFELNAWIENVLNFVRDLNRDAPDLYDIEKSRYIKSYVTEKIIPLKRVMHEKESGTVIHALNMTALKAMFQCDVHVARFVYYLGAATDFQLTFSPDEEGDGNSYEIFTLFSHGKSWNFGA